MTFATGTVTGAPTYGGTRIPNDAFGSGTIDCVVDRLVPEPVAAAALLAGLGTLATLSRRRGRRTRSG